MTERKPKSFKCQTLGSTSFHPDEFFDNWPQTAPAIKEQTFEKFIQKAFQLKVPDDYVYHAMASVSLSQVQKAIDAGDAHGLHDWYRDKGGVKVSCLAYYGR
jgi:hypothetical protein